MFLFVLKEVKDYIIGKEKLGDIRVEIKVKKVKLVFKWFIIINKVIEEGKDSFFLFSWYIYYCLFFYIFVNEV